jgi:clan AA aspartic protease (TIGR02281 family)
MNGYLACTAVLCATLVAGCADMPPGKLSCPTTFIAPGLDAYSEFRPGVTPSATNTKDIIFGVKLATVAPECQGEPRGVRVTTLVTFVAVRNDQDLRQGDFTFFIAVADARQNIVAKQTFAVRVDFAPQQKEMRLVDQVTEHLPVSNLSLGNQYAIIIGLQVSQQQLDLNRKPQPQPPATQTTQVSHAAVSEIALQRQGGTYVVPVTINNSITLNFELDSGAADVSVPADVFLTLTRTGTITSGDLLGERTYVLANGSKVRSQTFRIRSLKVGNTVLENVAASVSPVQGSLLLGQSFLSRLKSWSIDNNRNVLMLAE